MLDFDELEENDPSPGLLQLQIGQELLCMDLPRKNLTPLEVTTIWEQEWGIAYAGRVKFKAPEDWDKKWLNIREDKVPEFPAVVRIEASMGSVLEAIANRIRSTKVKDQEEQNDKEQESERKPSRYPFASCQPRSMPMMRRRQIEELEAQRRESMQQRMGPCEWIESRRKAWAQQMPADPKEKIKIILNRQEPQGGEQQDQEKEDSTQARSSLHSREARPLVPALSTASAEQVATAEPYAGGFFSAGSSGSVASPQQARRTPMTSMSAGSSEQAPPARQNVRSFSAAVSSKAAGSSEEATKSSDLPTPPSRSIQPGSAGSTSLKEQELEQLRWVEQQRAEREALRKQKEADAAAAQEAQRKAKKEAAPPKRHVTKKDKKDLGELNKLWGSFS